MGRSAYITHADFFTETKEHPITEEQWLAAIKDDPSIRQTKEEYYGRREADGSIAVYYPYWWIDYPEHPSFYFMDGAVECGSPDESTMIKMVELAERLGAKVLDEDDGTYTVSDEGKLIFHPPE